MGNQLDNAPWSSRLVASFVAVVGTGPGLPALSAVTTFVLCRAGLVGVICVGRSRMSFA